MKLEDFRLLDGGLGCENEIPTYDDSPTWLVDNVWDQVQEIAKNSLSAYMDYCKINKIPHSFLLGLDILITGVVDPKNPNKIIDIRPTIMEGPCCNSYPACPNLDSYLLYKRAQINGLNPDMVDYPTHPTKILDKLIETFKEIWEVKGKSGLPTVGIFTRPYPESEEENAHVTTLNGFKNAGFNAFRITPAEKPFVRDGKICVNDTPIDICYRRIERIHVPIFYGEKLGDMIIKETPNTIWINPFEVDDLRSKTIEEKVFRAWEEKTKKTISRPKTLLENEISSNSIRELSKKGGYVLKRWNSTGGKGVFLHVREDISQKVCQYLYERYDGRHMVILDKESFEKKVVEFDNFKEDTSIQELRFIDARPLDKGKLVYDTRINVIYSPKNDKWSFLSGISRVVKCGKDISNGNSLLTNISSGAEIAPLIFGYTKNKKDRKKMKMGPLMQTLLLGKKSIEI